MFLGVLRNLLQEYWSGFVMLLGKLDGEYLSFATEIL